MRSLLAALLIALALPGVALATTVLKLELAELTRESDAVVRGKVSALSSRWANNKIVTEITLEVAEIYKGQVGKSVTIVQPGGVVGDIGQRVHGMPEFRQDSEVVVFLDRAGDKVFQVVGMAQGLFNVQTSSDGKATFVLPADVDATVLDPSTREAVQPRTNALSIETFHKAVKAIR